MLALPLACCDSVSLCSRPWSRSNGVNFYCRSSCFGQCRPCTCRGTIRRYSDCTCRTSCTGMTCQGLQAIAVCRVGDEHGVRVNVIVIDAMPPGRVPPVDPGAARRAVGARCIAGAIVRGGADGEECKGQRSTSCCRQATPVHGWFMAGERALWCTLLRGLTSEPLARRACVRAREGKGKCERARQGKSVVQGRCPPVSRYK